MADECWCKSRMSAIPKIRLFMFLLFAAALFVERERCERRLTVLIAVNKMMAGATTIAAAEALVYQRAFCTAATRGSRLRSVTSAFCHRCAGCYRFEAAAWLKLVEICIDGR